MGWTTPQAGIDIEGVSMLGGWDGGGLHRLLAMHYSHLVYVIA